MWRKSLTGFTALLMLALIASPVLTLQGCGGGKDDVAISGSTIVVNPTSVTVASLSANFSQDFIVTVKYPDGTPCPKTNVHISGGFAVPRNVTGTNARYQFYYGSGGELGPNNDPALAQPVPSGFTAQTDDAGNYTFSITVFATVGGVANAFTDNINVTSGEAAVLIPLTIS